jgi:putative transcriptional regulator
MTNLRNILNIKYNNIKPAPGKILVAEPFMNDYYFKRSVVLLADHSDEGSFGIIINKPLKLKIQDVHTDIKGFAAPIHLGGPVSNDRIFFTHTLGNEIEGSIKILDGLYWGGNINQIKGLIAAGVLTPDHIRFYLGYAGWSPHQLEEELKRNSWLVGKGSTSFILQNLPNELWKKAVESFGSKYEHWTKFPVEPIQN